MPHVLGLQERLKRFGLVELFKDAHLIVVTGLLVWQFNLLLNPATLLGVLNVHVLKSHRATVRVAQDSQHIAQGQRT